MTRRLTFHHQAVCGRGRIFLKQGFRRIRRSRPQPPPRKPVAVAIGRRRRCVISSETSRPRDPRLLFSSSKTRSLEAANPALLRSLPIWACAVIARPFRPRTGA